MELREGDDHADFVHAFNGYAPAADVEVDIADLVYTHYTRVEDLQELGEIKDSAEERYSGCVNSASDSLGWMGSRNLGTTCKQA